MRPVNTHRKLRIRGDSIGSASKYKLQDPVTPRDSNLDSSDSDDAPDSGKKIKTLPDYQSYSKDRDLFDKSRNTSKPHIISLPFKNLLSFPEIATERSKLNPPNLFEKNLYEKEKPMGTMTKMISDYMTEKLVRSSSKSNIQAPPSQKSLNYVVLGKNLYLSPAAPTERFTKRQSLPPGPSFRRLKTDFEELPPLPRIRHQNSIENTSVPRATYYRQNTNKSKISPNIERTSYSKSPDENENEDSNRNSIERIANNFFVKNKDKFHIATSLKKRAIQLTKEKYTSSNSEWLNKALASNRTRIKPQFKAL